MISGFARGVGALIKGFELMWRPGIKRYAAIPFAVNAIVFVAVIYFGAHAFSGVVAWAVGQLPDWLAWLNWLLWLAFSTLALLVVFYCFTFVIYLIGFPFNYFLAVRLDRDLNGKPTTQLDEGFWYGLREDFKSVWKMLCYQAVWSFGATVICLILLFIPVVNLAVPFVWFVFSAWMLALIYSDLMLNQRGHRFSDQRRVYSGHRGRVLGFGCATAFVTMIPIVNLLVLPAATSGAVWLWQDISPRQA